MTDGSIDYKFGNKNNWRRTMWNRIAERLAVPAQDAVVIYLAGGQDLDRAEARRRGFLDHNLIAVERDATALATLRARGTLCIDGDFIDAVNAWPPEREVHVLFGDFCSGLELRFGHALRPWMNERRSFHRAVFAFNMLRGRDPSGGVIRRELSKGRTKELWDSPYAKHRGVYLFELAWHQFSLAQQLRVVGIDRQARVLDPKRYIAVLEEFVPVSAAWFGQYKSGPQVFDSVVWRNPYQFMTPNPDRDEGTEDQRVKASADASTRRKVSAILAHRTMRLRT